MKNKTFSCCLGRSLISASVRLFALNGALKHCRYLAKITAALPLVAKKTEALLNSVAVPSSAHNLLPPGISSLFTNLSTIHSRQTRSQAQKSLYPNFQLNVVKGLLNFRALKSGICFPLNLKSFRLENLKLNSKINL